MSPLTPVLALLLGAAALLLGLLPRFRFVGLVAVAGVTVAFVALLPLAFSLPARATLSAWGPDSLLNAGLGLEVDPLSWLFALGVVGVTLATLLTGLARAGGRRIAIRGVVLLLASAGLVSIFSGNLLTRVLAWAGLDLVYFLALVYFAEGEGLEPQAVLNLSFNSAGTLLAVAAALAISRTSDTLSLRDAALTSQSTLLITLAAVFRLGLFPLHLGLPTEINLSQGLGTMLRLIPAAVALETMSRLAAFGFTEPVRPWLTLFGLAALMAGAAQWWITDDPRRGMAYVIISQSGLALLGGLWGAGGGGSAVTLAAYSLALMLGAALIFLWNGHDEKRPWATALPLLGAATLIGAPFTAGFVGARNLYIGLLGAGGWGWLALGGVILAQTLLVAAALQTAFWPNQPLEGDSLAAAAYMSGLGLPALLLILAGLFAGGIGAAVLPQEAPPRGLIGLALSDTRSVIALALFVVATGGGLAAWRFERVARARLEVVGRGLTLLARLDWLYRLVWSLIHGVGSLIQNLAAVLEGEGAVLWTLVAALLVWLLFK